MNLNKTLFYKEFGGGHWVFFFFLAESDQIDRLAKAQSCRKTTETQYYL